ncbi:MAG TPA: pyridoxal phosphate-dependent aminotransferase [Acidimicrobiia bacterium]|nr:pyridoxal phosphate-dependent aminotransferase [Acidimicrobiia bacterium]
MAISTRAAAMRTAGEDVISFSAGEPDFATPSHIVEAAAAAVKDARNHHYTAAAGLPELREAAAENARSYSGIDVDPRQVLITNGGKQAVFTAMAALLDPGDEVLLPTPYWVTYPEAVGLTGATAIEVPTTIEDGFKVTSETLERHRTDATKMLVFVSPSNPTGAVYTAAEVESVGRWAADNGVWILTDEIYQRLVYGDASFVSLPGSVAELEDRWVVVNGVAKSYAMTGWRVGWLIGPPDVVSASIRLQSHLTSNVANVSQRAALAALTGPQDVVEEMRLAFDRRRQAMVKHLGAIDGLRCLEPDGAFYTFPDLSRYLGGRFNTTLDLATWILEEAGVALVPGEAFGAPGYARLSYALADADLDRGLERLADALAAI